MIDAVTRQVFATIARPTPMMEDPTYSGCANQRYGPDAVTSRALLRWPEAQTRRAFAADGDGRPVASVAASAARARARAPRTETRARRAAWPVPRPEKPGRGRAHTAASRRSTASMTSPARRRAGTSAAACTGEDGDIDRRVARDGDVVRRQRPVARRTRRTVDPDERRADAAATCVGPVSPEIISAAPRAMAPRDPQWMSRGAKQRAPASASRTTSCARLPRQVPTARGLEAVTLGYGARHLPHTARPATACSARPRPG